jgi:ferredoxin--NADP+ reductase
VTQPEDGHARVAVVGAGPAGFYAALELLKHKDVEVHIDLFDHLPTPFGLVRFGVAPDHPKIKSVTGVYERGVEAAGGQFRLFGNVTLGADVSVADLRARYHAVVFTFGAQTDRRLGVPGEDLPGVYPAREFVAWYNSHPDYRDARFDLNAEHAVVIGIGNVAIDVARILVRTPAELAHTDIRPAAADAVTHSPIREVTILARRGPVQAACTPVELRELTQMEGADLVVSERDLALDEVTRAMIDAHEIDAQSMRLLNVLQTGTLRARQRGRKAIELRFYVSPVEFIGRDRLEAVRLVRNRLVRHPDGWVGTEATGETEIVPCGAAFRSIGYQVAPIAGVPFDPKRNRIPHARGQILGPDGGPAAGLFVAGWAKRGPTGVIGTNKPDAAETVDAMLADLAQGRALVPAEPEPDAVLALLRRRQPQFVTYADWRRLDELEVARGRALGRPRVKFTRVEEMLAALGR